jgi:glycerophosphoryl diester phosphodiesterase
MQKIIVLMLTILLMSCGDNQDKKMKKKESIEPYYLVNGKLFDVQGHRGGRGLWPENSIPGFLNAVDMKVTTLEMDVVVSKDKQVVVSHDPYFNPVICSAPGGKQIDENRPVSIYKTPYSEVREYDCGSLPYPRFPDQEKIKTYKPLLQEVIQKVDERSTVNEQVPVYYNIEIKSRPEWDGEFQPATPDEYVKLVLDSLTPLLDYNRFNIQSFDIRILEAVRKYDNKVRLVYLVEEVILTPDIADNLSFIPEVFSPDFNLLSPELIESYHQQGMKVIPWTVNESTDIQRMIDWGVDGIISDYPDRLLLIVNNQY